MVNQLLGEFLNRKKEKQISLQERKKVIEDIEYDIFSANFRKSLNNIGNRIKAFIAIVLGGGLLIISLFLLVYPGIIYQYVSFIDPPKLSAEHKVSEYLSIIQLSPEKESELTEKIIADIESENASTIRTVAIFLLIASLYLLVLVRHLRRLRARNKILANANRVTQDILTEYKAFIKEEKNEIAELEGIMDKARSEYNSESAD